jgi:hypothetical protein
MKKRWGTFMNGNGNYDLGSDDCWGDIFALFFVIIFISSSPFSDGLFLLLCWGWKMVSSLN